MKAGAKYSPKFHVQLVQPDQIDQDKPFLPPAKNQVNVTTSQHFNQNTSSVIDQKSEF